MKCRSLGTGGVARRERVWHGRAGAEFAGCEQVEAAELGVGEAIGAEGL